MRLNTVPRLIKASRAKLLAGTTFNAAKYFNAASANIITLESPTKQEISGGKDLKKRFCVLQGEKKNAELHEIRTGLVYFPMDRCMPK